MPRAGTGRKGTGKKVDKLLNTLSYSDKQILDVMPIGDDVSLCDANGNTVQHRKVCIADRTSGEFTKITLNRCPNECVYLPNDDSCLVAVLQNNNYDPKVVWMHPNEIHHGYKLLQTIPKISYSGVMTIDKHALNDMALREFYDDAADNYKDEWRRRSLYKKYSTLFDKDPVLSLEAMTFLGMVLSSGRISRSKTRNLGRCAIRVPSPLDEIRKLFLGKALDDLGVGWCFKAASSRTVGSSENKSLTLTVDDKRLYLILDYLIGNDTHNRRDISRIVHMSPEHDMALIYGMILCRASIDDRADTGRGVTAEISTHDEDQFLLLYSLLMQYGLSPSVHINTLVRTNIVTTASPIVSGIRNIEKVDTFINQMRDFRRHLNNSGEYEFFTSCETKYAVHRVRMIERCVGAFRTISVGDNFGYVNGNVTVVGDSIWNDVSVKYVSYREDDGIANEVEKEEKEKRRINKPIPRYPLVNEEKELLGLRVDKPNLLFENDVVDTPDGYVHPYSIDRGDLIASSNGSFTEVTDVISSDVDADMIELKAMYLGSTIVSSGTKVLAKYCANTEFNSVNKNKHYLPYPQSIDDCSWIDVEKLQYGDVVLYPLPKQYDKESSPLVFDLVDYMPETKKAIYEINDDKIIWHRKRSYAGYAHEGFLQRDVADMTGLPQPEIKRILENKPSKYTDIVSTYLKANGMSLEEWRKRYKPYEDIVINRYCAYDDDLAYLIGFYIADGCVQNPHATIAYCLCIDDPQYEEAIREAMRNKFPGIEGSMIYNHNGSADLVGRGCNLYFHFPIFTNLVKSLIPWLADEKQIPDILLHQPEHTVDALLRGLTDGDGTLKNRGYSYASISERLSYQVMRILRCNSTPSYIKSRISANPITPNAKRAFICYASYSDYLVNQFDVDDRRGRFCGHKYRIIDDGNGNKYFAARIRSVRDVRRIGRAYEILTASDGYAASSCIIKNDKK